MMRVYCSTLQVDHCTRLADICADSYQSGFHRRLYRAYHPLSRRVITRSLKIHVRNLTRDVVLADAAGVADTSAKRRTGLLKHTHLEPGDGLWIVPCESVHCFFM